MRLRRASAPGRKFSIALHGERIEISSAVGTAWLAVVLPEICSCVEVGTDCAHSASLGSATPGVEVTPIEVVLKTGGALLVQPTSRQSTKTMEIVRRWRRPRGM